MIRWIEIQIDGNEYGSKIRRKDYQIGPLSDCCQIKGEKTALEKGFTFMGPKCAKMRRCG